MSVKLSVVIGIKNAKEGLKQALESVRKQHYSPVEVIIFDAQSTDGTLEVIQDYHDMITYWKSEKDAGHADACNKAIDIATGEFIVLLNAGDEFCEGVFEAVNQTYHAHKETLMISGGAFIKKVFANNETKTIRTIQHKEDIAFNLYNMLFKLPLTNARFYHRDLFKKYGKFNISQDGHSYYISNDRAFLVRLALAGVESAVIEKHVYTYYTDDHSLTFGSKNLIKIHREHVFLAHELLAQNHLHKTQKKLLNQWLARESIGLSFFLLKDKQFKSAFQFIFKACTHDFFNVVRMTAWLVNKKILKMVRIHAG